MAEDIVESKRDMGGQLLCLRICNHPKYESVLFNGLNYLSHLLKTAILTLISSSNYGSAVAVNSLGSKNSMDHALLCATLHFCLFYSPQRITTTQSCGSSHILQLTQNKPKLGRATEGSTNLTMPGWGGLFRG